MVGELALVMLLVWLYCAHSGWLNEPAVYAMIPPRASDPRSMFGVLPIELESLSLFSVPNPET